MTVLDIMQTWNVIEWQYQIELEGTKAAMVFLKKSYKESKKIITILTKSDQMDGLELEKKLSKKLKKDKDQK
jgi:hypothetical protein